MSGFKVFKDRTGDRVGRLTILERVDDYVYKNGRHEVMWRCKCDCGNIVIKHAAAFNSKSEISCGCSKIDSVTKHGMTNTRLDIIFRGMKQRCYDSNVQNYPNYGGRGIKICDEWLENKMKFFDWAICNGYSDELSIDRIDVNGDYAPDNCRWVTSKVQSNNRRNNREITYNGISKSIAEWSSTIGIPYHTIYSRLRSGWSVGRALGYETKPPKHI